MRRPVLFSLLIIGLLFGAFAFSLVLATPTVPLPPSNGGQRDILELLNNVSFEIDADQDKQPDGWKGSLTEVTKSDKIKCNIPEEGKVFAHSGNCAYMFRGNPNGSISQLKQRVKPENIDLITDGALMTFSAFIDPRHATPDKEFGRAVVKFSNGSKTKIILSIPAQSGGYFLSAHSKPISMPSGVTVTVAKVNFSYSLTSAKMYIDDVSLDVTSDLTATPTPEITLTPTSSWTLVWADEFEDPEINLANWTYDIGAGGWGNGELEYYTDRPENARIENGELIIEAREEAYEGSDYTSARLKTQGLQFWTHGRIEARIKLPYGQGIWPAFWTLGTDIDEVSWPDCGEIDIMEFIGRLPNDIFGTIHGPGYADAGVGGSITLDQPASDDYHNFAIEWTADQIRWYVDDVEYFSATPADVPGDWVFDHDFFLLLNVAVGGEWPGDPDGTTVFPQQMKVQYVRVYQATGG
ncbi:MAG TPA: glycoside hydrolase family 16 protein [Phototrophicaceae bacterium]|jgi:beta-glucanase (GH16 family)|nr:glycoside hydrolase family 16 protein [Phototrophicaceae bacterium]